MSTFKPVTLNDGQSIPGIGFGVGTAWFKSEKDKDSVNRELVETIKTALNVGYRHLDSAEAYDNEESVGQAIIESGIDRKDIFLTTKVGAGLQGKTATEALQHQLSLLKTDYVDLYLIHWPTDLDKEGWPTHEEAWKQLEEVKEAGLARSIGVSNFRLADLDRVLKVAKIKPAVNQIEFHPYMYSTKGYEVIPAQHSPSNNIRIEAYGPTSPLTKLAGGPLDAVLERVTKAVSSRAGKDVSGTQVLLKLAQQLGAIVITTSGKEWRMKEQLAAGALPELTEEEVGELKRAGAEKPGRVFMKHMDA